jgi:hypothetical protein
VRGGVRVEAEPEVAAEQVRGHHRALRRDGGEAVGGRLAHPTSDR